MIQSRGNASFVSFNLFFFVNLSDRWIIRFIFPLFDGSKDEVKENVCKFNYYNFFYDDELKIIK